MPNPFDLRGPEFLVFYIVLGVFVIGLVAVLRRGSEPPPEPGSPLTDYLRIAYLRGGADEAVRVAALALIDRGLVTVVDDDRMQATANSVPAGLLRTEERLLESCKTAKRASDVLSDDSLKITARSECEATLVRAGLLPDAGLKATRFTILLLAAFFLGTVAFVKIMIALGRGRTNIAFLVMLCIGFAVLLYFVANPFRTRAGEAMLTDLRHLFRALRERAAWVTVPSGGNDAALLAAVFGLTALPTSHWHLTRTLTVRKESSSSGCGSGGSSCGSSCGGGCGGGCGGCGS